MGGGLWVELADGGVGGRAGMKREGMVAREEMMAM